MVSKIQKRRSRMKQTNAEARSQETPKTKENRLAADRGVKAQNRKNETPRTYATRLEEERSRGQKRLQMETPVTRSLRISESYARTYKSLEEETPHARNQRVEKARKRLSEQSPGTRKRRNEEECDRIKRTRLDETPQTKQVRYVKVQEIKREAKANESSTETNRRRSSETTSRRYRRRHQGKSLDFDKAPAVEISKAAMEFAINLRNIEYEECSICLERFPCLSMHGSDKSKCCRCNRNSYKVSKANNMDPGTIPEELSGLTSVEEMLIAQIMPMMSVYRLPLGQMGYHGHIINLPQDVHSFLKDLPRISSEVDVMVVRRSGSEGKHKDFRVRRNKVFAALTWLKANNPYYHDITINEVKLAVLPEDGFLEFSGFDQEEIEDVEAVLQSEIYDDINVDLTSSFLPMNCPAQAERQRLNTASENLFEAVSVEPQEPIAWPTISAFRPVNEFETPGYIARAFPTLFAYGISDLNDSRNERVYPGQYFKHLLQYRDGRFARHARFRYFALNSIMRWRAIETGKVYIRQNPLDARLSSEDLRNMSIHEKKNLTQRMIHFGKTLRGTRQYWRPCRNELMVMIDTLGMAHIFFTLSCADLHWPELHRLLPGYQRKIDALNENPLIADWFFYYRVQEYLKTILAVDLGFTDYWLRFEYQHRGSPHVHGVAWLQKGLNVQEILASNDKARECDIVQFIDNTVSTWNPSLQGGDDDSVAPSSVNPCGKFLSDVLSENDNNWNQDYCDLINSVQRHTSCRPGYCLKKTDDKGNLTCRFHFPFSLQKDTMLERVKDEKDPEIEHYDFVTKRNDPRINSHNRTILQTHRANCDTQPIVCWRKLIAYIVKYATKEEPRSHSLMEVHRSLLKNDMNDFSPKKFITQLLMKTIEERDWSAQETCHLLMELPLVMCSRTFEHISVSGDREITPDGEDPIKSNIVDLYVRRPEQFKSLPLLECAKLYTMKLDTYRKVQFGLRKKESIVVVHPYIPPYKDHPRHEEYALQYLMLHRPFRKVTELLAVGSASAALERFLEATGQNSNMSLTRQKVDSMPALPEEQSAEDELSSADVEIDDWMYLCRLFPEFKTGDALSDQHFDWTAASLDFDLESAKGFLASHRESYSPHAHISDALVDLLNAEQRRAYNLIVEGTAIPRRVESVGTTIEPVSVSDRVESTDTTTGPVAVSHRARPVDRTSEPVRMIVYGTAGTGKSYLIHCLKAHFGEKAMLLAPTGVAAFNIGGYTLHSAFRLPISGSEKMKELRGEQLLQLQDKHREVVCYLIDEVSMIGRSLLGKIDQRMRQAFPNSATDIFGGKSVVFFGDFGQLMPVMDSALFSTTGRGNLSDMGRTAYQTVDKCVVLNTVVRQSTDTAFADILQRLRNGETTAADFQVLSRRFVDRLDQAELNQFTDAVRIMPTREEVAEFNVSALKDMNLPIANIKATHTGLSGAANCSSDEAGGLAKSIIICEGAKIMLTSNLWVDAGLCNGSFGTVHSIIYTTGRPPHLPDCVVCVFPQYRGPSLLSHVHGSFPVFPKKSTWEYHGSMCSRTNLPLQLAWAVTIHKEQGSTLPLAHVSLGTKEFSTGLSFVALSRVKMLNHLILEPFLFSRLKNLSKSPRLQERLREDTRLFKIDGQVPLSEVMLRIEKESVSPPKKRVEPPKKTNQKKQPHPSKTKVVSTKIKILPSVPTIVSSSASNFVPVLATTSIGTTRRSTRGKFDFLPVDEHWSLSKCAFFQIRPSTLPRHGLDRLAIPRTSPPNFDSGDDYKHIIGDGHCFYRAISFEISGSEEHWLLLRERTVEHMILNWDHFDASFSSSERPLTQQEVMRPDRWAHDPEIYSMANLLQTAIYIYAVPHSRRRQWHNFEPDFLPIEAPSEVVDIKRNIHLDHMDGNHFNVVLNVHV